MHAERWTQIQNLFLEALEQPPGRREALVRDRCGTDDALYDEVCSLLSAHEDEGIVDQLEGVLAQPVAPVAVAVGQRVGPYRIERLIGEGGMGAVYLAERADGQYERQVALKLVRLAAGPLLARRLLAERQILARLSHPHIAQLLDGGVTETGQPYFAMEYVDGRPFDTYCDAERLPVSERLRLFLDICEAVGYAHQNLVIHRDLKPSNVLVTEPVSAKTGTGQVKLLDFGIARLLEEGAEGILPTRTHWRALTPAYASPEQVRGDAMTTASDVYSLGVMLYEALTGRRPYDVDDQPPSEVERVVCEVEPVKPSTAIGQAGEPERISAARQTAPDPLRRRLAGDLDVIVMKTLRKEPAHRYASALELRNDLRRYLDGLPIQARPATLRYRAATFVRRHRIPVAAAVLVLLSLIGGLTVAIWQGRVAAAERDRARLEAEKAEHVAAFLAGLFEESDPERHPAAEKTARELLAEGAARIERELAAQPIVQARMMGVIGEVYQKLALYDEARTLLEGALARRQTHLGPRHPDVLISRRDLAALHMETGAYETADSLVAQVLQAQRADPDVDPVELARTLDLYGNVRHWQEAYDGAEAFYREALALRRAAFPKPHREVAISLANLGSLLHARGDLDAAEGLYQEALAIDRTVLGETHPDVAIDLNGLGYVYYDRGDFEVAESLFRESLAIRRRAYGDNHPRVATGLNNLAIMLHEQQRLEEAEGLYREALTMRRAAYGEDHDRVAVSLGNLGSVLHDQGKLAEAEAFYREALALRRRLFGDENSGVAIQMNNVGRVLQDQGRLDEAETLLRRALAISRVADGNEHPYVGIRLTNLAGVLHEQGRFSEAEALHEEALAIYEAALGADHWQVSQVRAMWGDALRQQGKLDEAEPLLKAGYDGLVATRGADDRFTREVALWLAALYRAQGRTAEADRLVSE